MCQMCQVCLGAALVVAGLLRSSPGSSRFAHEQLWQQQGCLGASLVTAGLVRGSLGGSRLALNMGLLRSGWPRDSLGGSKFA